ncbi:ElyC/SanA/YdcF family protein [Catenovulum sediminis]|uniref:ElyC/SanA/YdcF family protein n=1 Tax=Catenovulum sediminis TaxID=1740262 RepID=UPI00117F3932|nr:ElyC/SanA/YdcF family protein [Catenovulum sediminis]
MDLLFAVKKLIAAFIAPLPLTIALMITAYVLLLHIMDNHSARRYAKYFSLASILVLMIVSLPITSDILIRPLEQYSPRYQDALKQVDNIVVLGCYNTEFDSRSDIANVRPCSLYRLNEAIRLSRVYPQAKLILSGWSKKGTTRFDHSEFLAKVAISLGVNRARLVLLNGSKDTNQEAKNLASIMLNKNNLVVSSASHFKRIDAIFSHYNIRYTAVPAEYLASADTFVSWKQLIPSARALHTSERAIYEYLGNIWIKIRFVWNNE